jgi:hypothetical protein
MRMTSVRALAVAALVAVAGPPVAAEVPPALDQLVGYFDSVALQDDTSMFGSEGTVPKPVSRWEQPILVHISGSASESLEERLKWHLERFRLLSGVELSYVARRDQANLRITLTSSAEVTARAGSADTMCLTQYEPESGAIDFADIYLPLSQTVWLDNCMAHELMHAVGFYAHPKDNGNRSVLEQGAPPRLRTFTTLDVAGIRMLYDPRLRIGLERERALPIARAIAEELLLDWPDAPQAPSPGDLLGPDGFPPEPATVESADGEIASDSGRPLR